MYYKRIQKKIENILFNKPFILIIYDENNFFT